MSAAPVAGVSTGGTSRAPLSGTLKDWGSACTNPDQPKPTKKAAAKGAQRVTANFIFGSCNGNSKNRANHTPPRTGAYPLVEAGLAFPRCCGLAGHVILGAREGGDRQKSLRNSGCRLSRSARA